MKKWILLTSIIINVITILLAIDLASFDSMENHLTNGGIVFSRPINYSIFFSISILIATIINIYYLLQSNSNKN